MAKIGGSLFECEFLVDLLESVEVQLADVVLESGVLKKLNSKTCYTW